jgi:hypothetical protein
MNIAIIRTCTNSEKVYLKKTALYWHTLSFMVCIRLYYVYIYIYIYIYIYRGEKETTHLVVLGVDGTVPIYTLGNWAVKTLNELV